MLDLDRDTGESDVGDHRHRGGRGDRARGRRHRRRRLDRGNADADAAHRAWRAHRDAFGDKIPERACGRDRRRPGDRAGRCAVATHSIDPRQRRRRPGAVRSLAAVARHADAAFARGRRLRECVCDRATIPRAPQAVARALSGARDPSRPQRRGQADARRLRRDDLVAPRRRRGGGQGVYREAAGLQARHVARLRRELGRASCQRRRAGKPLPRRPGPTVDRYRARR